MKYFVVSGRGRLAVKQIQVYRLFKRQRCNSLDASKPARVLHQNLLKSL